MSFLLIKDTTVGRLELDAQEASGCGLDFGTGDYSLVNRLKFKKEVTSDFHKDTSDCNVENRQVWRQGNPLGEKDDTEGLNWTSMVRE